MQIIAPKKERKPTAASECERVRSVLVDAARVHFYEQLVPPEDLEWIVLKTCRRSRVSQLPPQPRTAP